MGRQTRSEAVVAKVVSCLSVDIMHKQGIVVYNTYHVENVRWSDCSKFFFWSKQKKSLRRQVLAAINHMTLSN